MNKPFTSVGSVQEGAGATALLVAGMHRSGTSALTGVLSLLGAELPRTLMRPGADNPKGYWEPAPAAALNDALLAELGTSWEDVLTFIAARRDPDGQPQSISAIGDVIKSEFSLRRALVIKDPRMAVLLDLWIAAAERVNLYPRVIVPVRNPLEVATSLKQRNGFAMGRSLLLWLAYFLAAERSSRGVRRAFIGFSSLLEDWRGQIQRLERTLHVKLPGWTPAAELAVDDFLTEADRHQHASMSLLQARSDVPRWVKDAYAWANEAARGEAEPDPAILDAIAAEFAEAERIFAPVLLDLKREADRLPQVEAALRSAEKDLQSRSESLQALQAERQSLIERRDAAAALVLERQARIAELEDALRESAAEHAASLQDAIARKDADIERLRGSVELKDIEIERLRGNDRRIAYLEEKVRARDARIAQFRDRLGSRDSRIEELEAEIAASEARLEAAHSAARQSEENANASSQRLIEEVGQTVAQLAAQNREQGRQLQAARLARWLAHGAPRKRFAKITRARLLRPLMRRVWPGRAAVLLASGLYAPADGPGGRAIVRHARNSASGGVHPLFDEAFYRQSALLWPRAAEQSPAAHYLWAGEAEGRQPHPLFDGRWYREAHRDELGDWPLTALEHYIMRGARAGLSPHPLFNSYYYIAQCDEAADRGENPLAHYCRIGWREGLRPHPLFDPEWYYQKNPDVREAGVPALLHYVTSGHKEGRDPHPLFSTSYYLRNNPDVAEAGLNALVHYCTQGWREARRPSEYFDPVEYLQANPDVAEAGAEPLTHYLTHGAWEARTGAGHHDATTLYTHYREQILAGDTPLEAWVRAGAPSLPQNEKSVSALVTNRAAFQALRNARAELQDNYDWPAYERLSSALKADEQQRLKAVQTSPLALIDCGADVAAAARRIRFAETDRPDVSIVIPVFNQIKFTLECLASIVAAGDGSHFEVIVIDDASTDETPRLLSSIPGVRYLRNQENLGYLRSVNRATEIARGRVLVLLNNDTQVMKGWMSALLQALQDETIGIAAPKMLYPNGRLQEAGAKLHRDGGAEMIGLTDDPALPRYNVDRDVDYVSGACLAIRRVDFESLGRFDESYAPAYCEDSDLCLRVRAMGKRVRYVAGAQIVHHLSVSSDAQGAAFKTKQVMRNQQLLVERWGETLEKLDEVRLISFYLPQFHAIRENDAWWGPGFTEWRSVARALPNFVGHYQPHAPAELGYYDLSNSDVMEKQAELARKFGIHGFCYYYYWFGGRRVLEAPIERMLQTGKPDLPFCLCWANENWTRTWDGQDRHVLLEQSHSDEDDAAIIADIIRYLRAPSYIRINGKPLLVVYRPQLLPNPKRTAETWRRACREAGVGEIYLAIVEVFEHALTYTKPADFGFDASIEFPPSGMSAPMATPNQLNPDYSGTVCDYHQVVRSYLREPVPGHTRFRGVMPSWDNTPRRQDKSYVFQGASPGAFQAWLERIIAQTRQQNFGDERLVFINAWNEWGEGAHLEPDLRFGRGWLEAVRNAHDAERLLRDRMP